MPKAIQLAENASLVYVSSGVHFKGTTPILEHLARGERELKKTDTIISKVEAGGSLVLEVETHIEFICGAGSFLPGLSANFIADEKVSMVIIHMVEFEGDKIHRIKYFWDQATLLKQLNVIGSRGNAWPIYAGIDQIALCKRTRPNSEPRSKEMLVREGAIRSKHESINLFDNEDLIEKIPVSSPAIEPPSPSARPPYRTFQEILNLTDAKGPSDRPVIQPSASLEARKRASGFLNLFSDEPDQVQPYRRVIGSGGGHSAAMKRASWTPWSEATKENM